jgi:SSS family solute:Na+ symporter
MAIQRYLSTRDVKSARSVLITSMVTDALVAVFLGALGLALLAYYQLHPDLLPDGQSVTTTPDKLFPSFIVGGLPVGLTGLVVAALLAAAMSSLSSGLNSSSSVITTDYYGVFRKRKDAGADHIRFARYVSVAIGVVVVVLSSYVGVVKGNLLEVAYKTVNTLVAPLFGLFFMAMFIRWATPVGTIVGAFCGLGVVVVINYWKEITGNDGISFLWAMPMGFIVQSITGSLVSLLPIGPPSKPLIHESQES